MTQRLDYNQIAPSGIKALGTVYGYILQSGLPAELVDLVYLRISQINNCAYCLDMHTRDLIKKGVKVEKLALLQAWAEAGDLFSARERAALAWAETVTRVADTNVPDEAFAAARAVFAESLSVSASEKPVTATSKEISGAVRSFSSSASSLLSQPAFSASLLSAST